MESFLKTRWKWLFFILSSYALCWMQSWVTPKEGLSICMCRKRGACEYWGPEETTVARGLTAHLSLCSSRNAICTGKWLPSQAGIMTGSCHERSLRYYSQAKEVKSGCAFSHPLAGLMGLWGLRKWAKHKIEFSNPLMEGCWPAGTHCTGLLLE